jgi:DNA-binding transcriptional MocR family regulator
MKSLRDAPGIKRTKADPLALREGHDRLTADAKLAGLTLATRMDEDGGSCFPSIARLAADTGLSTSTVCLALNELEAKGYLTRERGTSEKGGPDVTQYRASLPEGVVRRADKGYPPGGQGVVRRADTRRTGRDVQLNDVAGAHAHEGFAEACGDLTPQGSQVERWRTAFTESPDGFRSLVAQSASKRTPEAWLDARVKRSAHREVVALDSARLSPLDRATRYVNAAGWQLTDDDLAEVLGHQLGIEGRERHQLIETARTIRATKEAA